MNSSNSKRLLFSIGAQKKTVNLALVKYSFSAARHPIDLEPNGPRRES